MEKAKPPPPPEEEKVLVEELSRTGLADYDRRRAEVAETLGIRVGTLDDLVATERRTKRSIKPAPPKVDAKKEKKTAGDLVGEPDVLTRFGRAIESAGLVGETTNAKILFLALTSRLFERPVSVAVKGVSAGGKSFTVESVLKFFPQSAYFARTGFSEKALYFSEEDFQHRFIVLFEADAMDSDYVSYVVRTLLSENRLSYELPVKTPDGIKPQLLEKEGPTGLITTTTAARLHPENETRLLSLGVTDTKQQTQAVMKTVAADRVAAFDYAQWRAFQAWLSTGERRVVIPYAPWLATKVPPVAVRLRRDFGMLLSLIRSHAVLHRETRDKDERGRIIATPADYAAVHALVEGLFAEGIEATVPPTIRETVTCVRDCLGNPGTNRNDDGAPTVSLTALAKELGLDKNSVHHRVRKAIAAGYLSDQETRRGKAAQIVLAEPLPEEGEILPAPGVLECWSDFGGDGEGEAYLKAGAASPTQVNQRVGNGEGGGIPPFTHNPPPKITPTLQQSKTLPPTAEPLTTLASIASSRPMGPSRRSPSTARPCGFTAAASVLSRMPSTTSSTQEAGYEAGDGHESGLDAYHGAGRPQSRRAAGEMFNRRRGARVDAVLRRPAASRPQPPCRQPLQYLRRMSARGGSSASAKAHGRNLFRRD
jgi:hypothetical protein